MTIAAFLGTLLPLIFERFHIDPALSTGPFVTMVVDVIAIIIYLNIARLLHAAL